MDPAVKGTITLVEAVQKYNPNIKRVVVTSSFASIIDISKGRRPGYAYSEKDWNPVTWEIAADSKSDGSTAYCASKTFAEKAAWEYVEKNKPNFAITSGM